MTPAQQPVRSLLRRLRRPAVTVGPDSMVSDAVARMADGDIGAVVVPLDTDPPSWGVLAERDVVRKVVARGLDPTRTRVGDAMYRAAPRVSPDASIQAALHYLTQVQRRHAIVTRDAHLLGVVSMTELADALTSALERDVRDLVGYISTPREEPEDG